ncbi:MAG: right-handed parallel beta-helix repeat-containing protein [Planctomycetes bacterium]|nr:right-handed parallel beta-helix repeat-containing protein [Planctomycetota bacterium]
MRTRLAGRLGGQRIVLCVCVAILCGAASVSTAADRYVKQGASGSGTSWADAYGELGDVRWSTMGSGDTLWIGAGNYGEGLPSLSVDGITVKRATRTQHGASAGWSDAFDGRVAVDPSGEFLVVNSADDFTLDGADHHPWSFQVVGISGANGMLRLEGVCNNAMIRNVEFDGKAERSASGEDGLRVMGGDGIVIEHCFVHDYQQNGTPHNDGIQMPRGSNLTIRYSIWANNGMHIFLGDVAWLGSSGWVNNIRIHHNVFYNDPGICADCSYNTLVWNNVSQQASHYCYIENNTFATRVSDLDSNWMRMTIFSQNGSCQQQYFRNNIIYDGRLADATSGVHSNNCYYRLAEGTPPTESGGVAADPRFVDYEGNDYRLGEGSPCKDAGANLGYETDIVGTSIPQNAVPDIGAYESPANAPGTAPAAPTNLRVQ